MAEQLAKDFKDCIRELLSSMDRTISGKDLAKAFHQKEGGNIHVKLAEIYDESLYNYLRYECNVFCTVYRLDGEVKIHRNFELIHKQMPKKKSKKDLPKLNFPIPQPIVTTAARRANLQKKNQNISRSKSTGPQVKQPKVKSKTNDEDDEELEVLATPMKNLKLNDFVKGDLFPEKPAVESAEPEESSNAIPAVNSMNFPSLPETKKPDFGTCRKIFKNESHENDQEEFKEIEEIVSPFTAAALPSFSFYPDVIVNYSFKVPQPKLQKMSKRKSFVAVITSCFNPNRFYFQYDDLTWRQIMNDMAEFYNSLPKKGLVISMDSMKPGLVVAVKFSDFWHRAIITSEPTYDGHFSVHFLDFGATKIVHISHARYLLVQYASEPVKALRGSLYNLFPKGPEWSDDACASFFSKIYSQDNKFYATVRSYISDFDVYEIELYEYLDSLLTVADELVKENYAMYHFRCESLPYGILLPGAHDTNDDINN